MAHDSARPNLLARLAAGLTLAVAAGCHVLDLEPAPAGESPLRVGDASADAVTLEVYWIDLPADVDQPDLWGELFEDRLEPELRERLASNGLRAAVAGATPPDALLRLIDPNTEADMTIAGATPVRSTGVRRRTRQLRPGDEMEINASTVLDEAPLFVCRGGRVTGKTYYGAQGVYVLSVDRSSDGRTELRLAPQVRHGEQLLRFVSDDTGAITRGSLQRPTEAFTDLAIAAPMSAGETLLVSSLPGAGARLGGLLHAVGEDDEDARKAILIRVAGEPASRAFAE
ncbi:MAG: hypothetical protein AAGJ46_02650 [Planctomycetota bacterium]